MFGVTSLSYAEIASLRLKTVELKDGSEIKIRQWGDEFSHGWQTEDGYSILKDSTTGDWFYAKSDKKGRLVQSNERIGLQKPPSQQIQHKNNSTLNKVASVAMPKYLRQTGEALRKAQLRRKNAHGTNSFATKNNLADDVSNMSSSIISKPLLQGKINVPVMLLNFSNTSTTATSSEFDQFLFSDSKGLTAYYDEVSYGNLTIQGGNTGVINWVKLPQNHDFYGQNNSSGYDANIGVMIEDALDIADSNIDFSQYADVNEDCTVDLISFVYQGNGEHQSAGESNDIWAHKYSLYWLETEGDGSGQYQTNDTCLADPTQKMIIDDYFVAPELSEVGTRANVGTFAHEFGHVFGLPDLYDTNGSTSGQNAGAGDWSLMASGSKTGPTRDGESPAHLSAWGKYTLGWISPLKINDLNDVDFTLAESSGKAEAILYENPSNPQEYFIIENRNKRGFDAYSPGTGLAIWHIDDDIAAPGSDGSTQSDVNAVSCDFGFHDCSVSHNGVALVSADYYYDLEHDYNDGDIHDLFGQDGDGGSSEYGSDKDEDNEFSSDGQITSNWWDDSASGLRITNISSKGDSITLDIGDGTDVPPVDNEIELVNNSHEVISVAANGQIKAYIDVPQNAENLEVSIEHNDGGDADLYLHYGSYVDTSDADCFLNTGNNTELCNEAVFGTTQAGTYYALVKGYNGQAFNNVSLRASYDDADGGNSPEVSIFEVNVASGIYQHFEIEVPSGANSIEVSLDKNGGAAMLMLNEGSLASARTYDEKDNSGNTVSKNNPNTNTWFIAVRGRSNGVANGTLTVTVL